MEHVPNKTRHVYLGLALLPLSQPTAYQTTLRQYRQFKRLTSNLHLQRTVFITTLTKCQPSKMRTQTLKCVITVSHEVLFLISSKIVCQREDWKDFSQNLSKVRVSTLLDQHWHFFNNFPRLFLLLQKLESSKVEQKLLRTIAKILLCSSESICIVLTADVQIRPFSSPSDRSALLVDHTSSFSSCLFKLEHFCIYPCTKIAVLLYQVAKQNSVTNNVK